MGFPVLQELICLIILDLIFPDDDICLDFSDNSIEKMEKYPCY